MKGIYILIPLSLCGFLPGDQAAELIVSDEGHKFQSLRVERGDGFQAEIHEDIHDADAECFTAYQHVWREGKRFRREAHFCGMEGPSAERLKWARLVPDPDEMDPVSTSLNMPKSGGN